MSLEEKKHEKETKAAKPMRGADIIVKALEREGVEVVFAYPGGASMEIHQALTRSSAVRTILPRHEQGGIFAAEGYARASGRVGVCIATSGPGATNLMTGIADAYMDSVPIVAITGQVPRHWIGKNAFQETDVVGITRPIVKHNYLVQDIHDLARMIQEAFYIASSGRPGPVVVDIPKDIQQMEVVPEFRTKAELRSYKPNLYAHPNQLKQIANAIAKAKKPVLYVGGGVISSGASSALRKFAEKTHIPVAQTVMGLGAFPETHPLALRMLGMHGSVYANNAVNEADLLLAFGVRFDDRVTGKVEKFAEHATIVHVDIDPSEINKNRVVQIPVVSDVRYAFEELFKLVKPGDYSQWHHQIEQWRGDYPLDFKDREDCILPQYAIRTLAQLTEHNAIITVGVGQHQMWTAQHYMFTRERQFLSSSGLGAMGFGLPAALGAKLSFPEVEVIDIDGDGSFLMNIQELATAHLEKIPVKVMILNNQHLGMVVQWEDRFYQGNRAHTYIGDPSDPGNSYPDFVKIANGFKIPGSKVTEKKDLVPAIRQMLAAKTPYVLDVVIPYQEHVLPMIPSGKTYKDVIIE